MALLDSGSTSLFSQYMLSTLRLTEEIKTLFILVIAKTVAGKEDRKSCVMFMINKHMHKITCITGSFKDRPA